MSFCKILMDLLSIKKFQLVGSAIVPYWKFAVIYLAVILTALAIIGNKKQAVIFWSQLLFCIVLETLKWFSNVYRVILVIYTMMFWLWNYNEDEKQEKYKNVFKLALSISMVLFLLITIPQYVPIMIEDYTDNYSASKDTAEYINNNINKGAVFISTYEDEINGVIGYLKKDEYLFYSLDDDDYFTYVKRYSNWTNSIDSNNIDRIIKGLVDGGKKDIYFIEKYFESRITYASFNFEVVCKYRCIKNVNSTGEEYAIYKVDIGKYI